LNFFDAQDNAKRVTRWLVVVYAAATLLIVAGVTAVVSAAFYGLGAGSSPNSAVLAAAAAITLLVILGATLYRTARLAGGGSRVAEELGGVRIGGDETDLLRRRFRNVVEEMSIASGVAVPAIYVLEHEQGINAFAAGFTPGDAAIAVTRGALEVLNRNELQGVVAHEFSHVLNGDMRLNIRMMGVLFGIMVIGLIGRMILRGGSRTGVAFRSRGKNAGGVLAIGVGLAVLGWIGVFFARVIKAAVSRQREYLADASAVQFTRQTDGIANALKKIGGYRDHSFLKATDSEEISHMLFARGARWSSLFATHPPLGKRIRALDPQFDESRYPDVRPLQADVVATDQERAAGFDAAAESTYVDADGVVASVGQPGPDHIAWAGALHGSIPEELLAPARSPDRAWLLTLSLMLDRDESLRRRQLELLSGRIGSERTALVRRYAAGIEALGPACEFALLEIAVPALRSSGEQQQAFLIDLAAKLVEIDQHIDLSEFCRYRVLARSLREARRAAGPGGAGKRPSQRRAREEAVTLLTILADRGHDEDDARQAAFAAGLTYFGNWSQDLRFVRIAGDVVPRLRRALDVLENLNAAGAETLVRAATAVILSDGRLTIAEAELLRTLCASLGCPLPPVIGRSPPADERD